MLSGRKLLVKIFNLIFIAAVGVSAYFMVTKPIISMKAGVSLTQEQVGTYVSKIFGTNKSSEETPERAYTRASEEEAREDMDSYLTPENIAKAFPEGFKLEVPIEVPANYAFDFNNKEILKDLFVKNVVDNVKTAALSVARPLHDLFKNAATYFASNVLADQINATIQEHFKGADDVDPAVVDEIFDNCYALIDKQDASVTDLANAILGTKDPESGEYSAGLMSVLEQAKEATGGYTQVTITEEEFNTDAAKPEDEKVYFVKVDDAYVHPTAWDAEATYYKVSDYDPDDISAEEIADAMANAFAFVPGLVDETGEFEVCHPTQAQVEEDIAKAEGEERKYYVQDGDNYVLATSWSDTQTYYKKQIVIHDVETALSTLLNLYLNGGEDKSGEDTPEENPERAIKRGESIITSSEDELKELFEELIFKLIPMAQIEDFSANYSQYAPYVLLGLIGIVAFPWLIFGLVTLIRTLRRRKVWTNLLWFFILAFPQVILGVVLTYGTKYAIPLIAERVEAFKEFAEILNFDIRLGCLIPSFIYLGMVVLAIPYWIIAHPVKVEYKIEKHMNSIEKRRQFEKNRREGVPE